MDEVNNKNDVPEAERTNSEMENFRKIIPESEIAFKDSQKFWDKFFDDALAEAEIKEALDNTRKQEIADKAAQDYNEKTKPYDRAIEKGLEGVKKTDNGGVSFEDSPYIYTNEHGDKAVVTIKATGNRSADFDAANAAFGLEKTPEGYVWHHVDDYNVKDGTITLELVKDDAHNATKPHSGGCAQYDAVNGPSYNPPRKGE